MKLFIIITRILLIFIMIFGSIYIGRKVNTSAGILYGVYVTVIIINFFIGTNSYF